MNFWEVIKTSLIVDGKPSSSRIMGYFVSINIALSGFSFVVIDIVNAIIAWKSKEGSYEIPGTHVALFGMMLAHQLSLLGIYKAMENKGFKLPTSIPLPEKPKEENSENPS
jgi:hypothetical protein